jgi:hypothetical protein
MMKLRGRWMYLYAHGAWKVSDVETDAIARFGNVDTTSHSAARRLLEWLDVWISSCMCEQHHVRGHY